MKAETNGYTEGWNMGRKRSMKMRMRIGIRRISDEWEVQENIWKRKSCNRTFWKQEAIYKKEMDNIRQSLLLGINMII